MKIKLHIAVITLVVSHFLSSSAFAEKLESYFASAHSSNNLALLVSIIDSRYGTNITELPVVLLFKAPTNSCSAFYLPQEENIWHVWNFMIPATIQLPKRIWVQNTDRILMVFLGI